MPKYNFWPGFMRSFKKLTPEQQQLFLAAVRTIVASMKAGKGFPAPPLVEKLAGHEIWEVRWAANGRATFHLQSDLQTGEDIIIWRRIGGHEILANP
jgi:hypothetical protein